MQNDTNFSPQESLQLIEGMIKKAQNRFAENGHLYLLWGWVVLGCSMMQFVLSHFFNYAEHYRVWMITWLLFVYQIFYLRKHKKNSPVKTYYDDMIGYVWVTFVMVTFLICFVLGRFSTSSQNFYILLTPILLAMYGMPVFLSGIILRFKPLILGGIGCWMLSLICSFIGPNISYDYSLLFIPAAMLIAWIIPGYLMRKKYLQTN